ncbi:MAG: peptide deformylase [Bacteroidales bacterium]|nr:peptide deformylase [Bacteroidales bacterium]
MIYPIVVYGSSVLRQVAKDIPADHPNLKALISDMFDTMYKSDGMGLAAPQIGKSLRLFVVDATSLADEDPALADFKKAFINPRLELLGEDTEVMNEGCLSLPKIREEVKRLNRVRISYYDENFNFIEEEYEGLKARVIQHEYDHLDGILFIDRINPLRKKLLKGKLSDITKCNVDVPYKIKVLK